MLFWGSRWKASGSSYPKIKYNTERYVPPVSHTHRIKHRYIRTNTVSVFDAHSTPCGTETRLRCKKFDNTRKYDRCVRICPPLKKIRRESCSRSSLLVCHVLSLLWGMQQCHLIFWRNVVARRLIILLSWQWLARARAERNRVDPLRGGCNKVLFFRILFDENNKIS